jgi:hypothetical protein
MKSGLFGRAASRPERIDRIAEPLSDSLIENLPEGREFALLGATKSRNNVSQG